MAALAAAACGTPAIAAPVYFTDRASFDAATSALAFESFESDFSADPGGTTFASGLTAFTTGAGRFADSTAYNTDGSLSLRFDQDGTDPQTDALTFSFGSMITSFAVDIISFGDVGDGTLSVASDSGSIDEVLASAPPLLSSSNVIFFGVIDVDGFSSLSFLDTDGVDSVFYDSVSFGGTTVVPVPASLPLLACALGGLVYIARRKRKAA